MSAPANRIVVLMAELVPSRPETTPVRGPWTKAEQDAHWNALCDAVGTPGTPRPQPKAGPQAA